MGHEYYSFTICYSKTNAQQGWFAGKNSDRYYSESELIVVLFQICHSIARMEEVEGEREDGTAQGGGAGGKGEGVL